MSRSRETRTPSCASKQQQTNKTRAESAYENPPHSSSGCGGCFGLEGRGVVGMGSFDGVDDDGAGFDGDGDELRKHGNFLVVIGCWRGL